MKTLLAYETLVGRLTHGLEIWYSRNFFLARGVQPKVNYSLPRN